MYIPNPSLPQDPPLPPTETLPTMYDLPSEDPEDPGVPDEFHIFQPQLLRETCKPPTYEADRVFVGTDLNLYYDVHHTGWHKRPDWFMVLDVERATQQDKLRRSYVIWQEGISPFLVVELLSPGTEADDLGQTLREINRPPTKWQVYEQQLHIPYYAVFDRYENHFRLFQMMGNRYQELDLTETGYWFEELALGLRVWQGKYKGIEGRWLRWQTADGEWVLTDEQEKERAQQEKEQAQQRAEKLAEKLRSLGIDPEDV